MPYGGKPSLGCENCRADKKRCTLEKPSCARCVKLKGGSCQYRDLTKLRIRDETQSVTQRVGPRKVQAQTTQLSPASDSFTPIDVAFSLKPALEEVSINYFLESLAYDTHWGYIRTNSLPMDEGSRLAMQACGMVALSNAYCVPHGHEWSQLAYIQALQLLNKALQSERKATTDQVLMAVTMLTFYENLVRSRFDLLQSWKTHISGATELVRLRGKAQLKTPIGRALFRQIRTDILMHCTLDSLVPPTFLAEWAAEIEAQSFGDIFITQTNRMASIWTDLVSLEAQIETHNICSKQALAEACELETRCDDWASETAASHQAWRYYNIKVNDSPNVWNGVVHAYSGMEAADVWNCYRGNCIRLSKLQDRLAEKSALSTEEKRAQNAHLRGVRRRLMDHICASVPFQLGHAAPVESSTCVLMTSYNTIWPLFWAGDCAIEILKRATEDHMASKEDKDAAPGSPVLGHLANAAAQVSWIVGRLDHISKVVGIRWVDSVSAELKRRLVA